MSEKIALLQKGCTFEVNLQAVCLPSRRQPVQWWCTRAGDILLHSQNLRRACVSCNRHEVAIY